LDGEEKLLPAVQLPEVVLDCRANLDYIQLLPAGDTGGNFRGTVRLGPGEFTALGERNGTPMSGAAVALICSTGKVCGKVRTDSGGEFVFKSLPRGYFSVRVTVPGFYNGGEHHYAVTEGFESVYSPIYMQRCPRGNCSKNQLRFCQ
jgi:hypothetical protein